VPSPWGGGVGWGAHLGGNTVNLPPAARPASRAGARVPLPVGEAQPFWIAMQLWIDVSKYLLMKADRRQQIIEAAMQVFAQKGFRGTTTRDLASEAGVNEAIIFRYFKTKEELYSAIIEHKAGEHRNAQIEELERLASSGDDEKFFEAVGRSFLRGHEEDTTF